MTNGASGESLESQVRAAANQEPQIPVAEVVWSPATIAMERARLVAQAAERLSLTPVQAHAAKPDKTVTAWSDKKAVVLATLSLAAHELILMAEGMIGATGAEKKAKVKAELMKLVDALEKRVKLGPFNTLAWWLIEHAVDGIIEVVFRQLEARGVVNV